MPWLNALLLTTHGVPRPGGGSQWLAILGIITLCAGLASSMSTSRIAELRKETVDMFYHGFDNYMKVAFPEDELRPVSCIPLTRDQRNPRNTELNDVLGNYSLTLIDSLSTLAILASAPPDRSSTAETALRDFQDGIWSLVTQYGDGTTGPNGMGLRGRGFDQDSKVQVFETVIRGVGGLLSAHLFATGDLPIRGYNPPREVFSLPKSHPREVGPAIQWPNGFVYNGQLLRLALDLAERLLPAFYTSTGMPYPRVNLRHGVPFYTNSPLNQDAGMGQCHSKGEPAEVTETCSAGAGSLVLEFTVLSRLTGDARFEQLAKRAFWAVWTRRSDIGLIGAGVDAEGGHWIGHYAGIGAGADSFFEYALKSHILLSGLEAPNATVQAPKHRGSWLDPNEIYSPLSDEENSANSFLYVWQDAHSAIKRHLYSDTHHPHYVNAHLSTGSPQAYWIDSLGAYYPGLLTLAGELDEAIETNLLYTALWTRYAALPERWSVRDGNVEGGLGWWPGRPEFIESNYHIYRATKDPWYLYVGEMVLKDIKRRCWTKCGWAGLQDVRTGELSDRMESFFLGETAKYLYLLFDADHPLNKLDAPYVFTTEGHPLIVPRPSPSERRKSRPRSTFTELQHYEAVENSETCPVPPQHLPLTVSATAARMDIFHASSLIGLHQVPNIHTIESGLTGYQFPSSKSGKREDPTNHTLYPWTLPLSLLPSDGFCDKLPLQTTVSIEFPSSSNMPSMTPGLNVFFNNNNGLVRVSDGILIKNLQGIKLGMILEEPVQPSKLKVWRIFSIGTMTMGRDEKIYIHRDTVGHMADPSFTRVRESTFLDVVLQFEISPESNYSGMGQPDDDMIEVEVVLDGDHPQITMDESFLSSAGPAGDYKTMLSSLLNQVTSVLRDPAATLLPRPDEIPTYHFISIPAVSPTGVGAAPIVDVPDAPDPSSESTDEPLSFSTIYFAGQACDGKLPDEAVKEHQVIVMLRGGCTFSQKLTSIPSFTPTWKGPQLVIIVSDERKDGDDNAEVNLVRPLLDEPQHTPAGLLRHHQISMIMVAGGEAMYEELKGVRSLGLRRMYHVESQGLRISNLVVV